jgi:hypothetical protein
MKSKLIDGDADEMPRRADRYGHPYAPYPRGLGADDEQGLKTLSCDTYGHLVECNRYDARATARHKALPDSS